MINTEMACWRLEELASRIEQERLWMGRTDSEMSSFEEARCGLFDDAGVMRALESGSLRKTHSEELCLKFMALHELLKKLPENARPEDVIAHPRMAEVRSLAADLLSLLACHDSDSATRGGD